MERKTKRKILAVASAVLIGVTYYNIDHVYHPTYEILQEQKAFASYSRGKIYIGDEDYLNSLTDICEDDILVCDERFYKKDPNMKIYSSYRINDKEVINEILEVLCYYEECYPSPWERTIESMRLEWYIHNLSYTLDHRRDRVTDVDLNNKDEEKYNDEFLRKVLKL